MKKAKFLQDAKLDPARFYRNPSDILRDRRLTDEDRRQIIAAWERNAESGDGSGTGQEQLDKLRALRKQLDPGYLVNEPAPGGTTGPAAPL